MSQQLASMGAATDPRLPDGGHTQGSLPSHVLADLHDPNITIEEYLHHARITRDQEMRLYGPGSDYQETTGPVTAFVKKNILRKAVAERQTSIVAAPRLSIGAHGEATAEKPVPSPEQQERDASEKGSRSPRYEPMVISDDEWLQASRAARTATWSAVFYLITTDILGPFSTGWSFSQLGFGPGITLFTVFGVLSAYTGYQIWRMFIQMDSDRFPMQGYGDIAFRVFGSWARHITNVLQSFQFLLNVSLILITSAQSISQMSTGGLCFVVCVVVVAIAGFLIGQIRTLARFGWLASLAVFMNLLVIFCSMGIIAHSPPNYTAVAASYPDVLPADQVANPPPIFYNAGLPPDLDLVNNINGLMQAVFSFGGATIFVNLLSEMRRPMDFWKGLLCAELLIYLCYLVYGCFCYGMQGQYVFNPSYQGVAPYGWQTFGNVFELITGIIAACLYGNIGIKVLYNNVGRDIFSFPILESKTGKWIWVVFVPIYWILALVLAASIPQISNFQALVGAVAILQFTYTFPPLLMVAFKTQRDAVLPSETVDPTTGRVTRQDGGMTRWIRGYKKEWMWNTFDVVFGVGAFVTAVLGTYSAIYLMNQAYHTNPNLTGWSCNSPTGG